MRACRRCGSTCVGTASRRVIVATKKDPHRNGEGLLVFVRPVVYRVTSKLPAMHDWRLHKLSIGTTSPGQSVRAQEMLGMCQRTPPAFPSRNSTTNDPRAGRSIKPESDRCRCDAVPPNATPWLPHRPGPPVNASGFSATGVETEPAGATQQAIRSAMSQCCLRTRIPEGNHTVGTAG